jgi:hypothetical protein
MVITHRGGIEVPSAGNVDRRRNPHTIYSVNAQHLLGIEVFGCAWLESTDIRRDSVRLVLALAVWPGLFEGS